MIKVPFDERIRNIRSGSISTSEAAAMILKLAGKEPVYATLQNIRGRELANRLKDHFTISYTKPLEALTIADLAVLIAEWYTGEDIDCTQEKGIYLAAFCEYIRERAHSSKIFVPETTRMLLGMRISDYLYLIDRTDMPASFKQTAHEYVDTFYNRTTKLHEIFDRLYTEINAHYHTVADNMGDWTSYWFTHMEPLSRREMKIFGKLAIIIILFIMPMAFSAAAE